MVKNRYQILINKEKKVSEEKTSKEIEMEIIKKLEAECVVQDVCKQ